jgi:glycosyltransferase involved in cell wall biosynthesis
LSDEPELLESLQANARTDPPPLRTALEQVSSLRDIYTRPPAEPTTAPSRSIAFVVGADGAIARYRVHHPAEAIARRAGHRPTIAHYLDPDLAELTSGVEVVVLQRVPATVQILELVDTLRADGVLVLFDTDDLIVDPDLSTRIPAVAAMGPDEQAHYLEGVRRYRTTLEACDGALVSTPTIAECIERLTGLPAVVVPNGLGLMELRLAERARRERTRRQPDRVRIAYLSGSDSHQPDLDLICGPLATILERHPHVEFVVIGPVEPCRDLARFGRRVSSIGFQDWQTLPALLADIDINVAPLVLPSEFNEAKSAVKWLEASAMGIPTVASASAPFLDVIDGGVTGAACATSDEWVDALDRLVTDPVLRTRIGAAAQRRAELHHGPHITAIAYEGALAALSERRPISPRRSSWTPVAPDERAPSAPLLDPYDVDLSSVAVKVQLRRWVSRVLRR